MGQVRNHMFMQIWHVRWQEQWLGGGDGRVEGWLMT